MSVLYLMLPVDPPMLKWVEECGVPVDGVQPTGRAATFDEFRAAIAEIPGFLIEGGAGNEDFELIVDSEARKTSKYNGPLPLPRTFEHPVSTIYITGYFNPDRSIKATHFHGGDTDLMLAIVRNLTRVCGPHLMYSHGGYGPWLVLSPDSDPIGVDSFPG